MTKDPLADLKAYFHSFSVDHAGPVSPLYAVLTAHVAGDRSLLEFAAKAKKGQPPANLLLGSVHYLLAACGGSDELAGYYPSLGGAREPDGDTARLFAEFVWDRESELLDLMLANVTNTNEVARAALLLPGLLEAAREAQKPLALVEIGPSCGLVLCWDKYRYQYGDLELGDPNSTVTLAPELRGPPPPIKSPLPDVASRTGLEMHPVDLTDPHTIAWQRALIWPEHQDRAARFDQAIEVARTTEMEIIAGDAVETISDVIACIPEDQAICVHHSFAAYQIPPKRRRVLSEILREASKARPIWRVGVEWAGVYDPDTQINKNILDLARYQGGNATFQKLAFCESHGRWIEWSPEPLQDGDRL